MLALPVALATALTAALAVSGTLRSGHRGAGSRSAARHNSGSTALRYARSDACARTHAGTRASDDTTSVRVAVSVSCRGRARRGRDAT